MEVYAERTESMMKIEIIFVAKSEQLANSVVFHYGSICLKANTVTSWKI